MKNLILIMCVCVLIGCGGDKKNKIIKYYEEEVLIGKVKEISLSRYFNIVEEEGYKLNTKIIDSLDINGNIINSKEYKLTDPVDEKSLYLNSRSIYTYNNEEGLNTKTYINMEGVIIGKDTITLINDNKIKILSFIDNKVFDSKDILSVDSSLKVLSATRFSKDSIQIRVNKKIWSGNNVSIISINTIGDKEDKVEYKYNKFDKVGNWVERDVIFYEGGKVDYINKEKRNISYYK
jgi:hypothetical protein